MVLFLFYSNKRNKKELTCVLTSIGAYAETFLPKGCEKFRKKYKAIVKNMVCYHGGLFLELLLVTTSCVSFGKHKIELATNF